uniref:Uncharacterized protein n=1 Tax=Piliocolobus tephrosceles TaxID=591936 RepID=A0A8C9GMS4_9PRIM
MFLTTLFICTPIPDRQWIGMHWWLLPTVAHQSEHDPLPADQGGKPLLAVHTLLTLEQQHGHATAVCRAEAMEAMKMANTSKFPQHRSVVDKTDHLNIIQKWS